MAAIELQMIPYGGVHWVTTSSICRELIISSRTDHSLRLNISDGDSLLPRRRSVALSQFYEATKGDVIVTVDHDISWRPGNVIAMAERALELDAIVGGLYSKRAVGQGFGSRFQKPEGEVHIPSDRMLDAQWVASGFMAIPRRVVRKMIENPDTAMLKRCWDGKFEYWDFYHTMTMPHPARPELHEYLSEDWALCERARRCGVEIKIDLRPVLIHIGERGFNVGDAMQCPMPSPPQAQQNS